MRERWGACSVKDHVSDAPLVSEVLLYDRLVVPVPDPDRKAAEEQRWLDAGWQPELQDRCLSILGIKTDRTDGLALAVSWDAAKQERFATRMSASAALDTQRRNPDASIYIDPFCMTRMLVATDFKPALPSGVTKAWTVANYPATAAFEDELGVADPGRQVRLAAVIRHRFLTPRAQDPDHELLRKAVELSTSSDFRKKRAALYRWQEQVIEEDVEENRAVEEMEALVAEYNAVVERSFNRVIERFAFTVLPIGLGIGGALLGGALPGIVLSSIGGLASMARFWRFDRKPVIDAGDCAAAAMIHDAREVLPLQ
jgi:hypothetical protein